MAERKTRTRPNAEDELLRVPLTREEIEEAELWKPLTPEEIEDVSGSTMAAAGTVLDSVLLGNLPNLMGAAQALPGVAGGPSEMRQRFIQGRDEVAAALAKAKQENPNAAGIGETAGTIASLGVGFGAGKLSSKAAEALSKRLLEIIRANPQLAEKLPGFVLRGSIEGAVGGSAASAAQAPTIREGEFDPAAELLERGKAGLAGAALGAPIGAIGGVAARAIDIPIQAARREAELVNEAYRAAIPSAQIAKEQARLGVESAGRKEAVQAAGKQLGIMPTRGMESSDPVIRNLESSLSQSPSSIGQLVSGNLRDVRNQLSKVAGGMLSGRADDIDVAYDVGSRVKEKLTQSIKNRYQPIREAYDQLAGDYSAIDLDKATKKRVIDNWKWRVEKSGLFREGSSRKSNAMGFLQDIEQLQTAQQLRNYISGLQSEIRAMTKAGQYDPVMGEMVGAADRLLERTVIKRAIEATGSAKSGKVGRDLAVKMFQEKKALDKEYRRLKEILGGVRGQIKKSGPDTVGTVLDAIDDMPSEKLAQVMFDTKNIDGLKFLNREFPDVVEELRAFKLREIADKATTSLQGEAGVSFVDPKKFLKEVDRLPESVREMLFGSKNMKKMDPLRTLTMSIPERVGPSGTPQGLDYSDLGTVSGWIGQNIRDVGRYGMMQRGVPGLKGMLFDIEKFPSRTQGASTIGAAGAGATTGSIAQGNPSFVPSPKLEGFPIDSLLPIDEVMLPQYLQSIDSDQSLSVIQKAKLKNLANKHKLAPVGR